MSIEQFMKSTISPWMKESGPDNDIVLSSRVRLARNLSNYPFPIIASEKQEEEILQVIENKIENSMYEGIGTISLHKLANMERIEKNVLVEKHLISPNLANESKHGAVLLSKNEAVSIMLNEEDHIRIQCLFSGLRLSEALTLASGIDDWLEEKLDYAFDDKKGYLTSCPTNVGTGLRASVMMHLPALVLTNQMNRLIPAVSQLGLVVRGMYGEGSEALGNIFQISNQITLGKTEEDIVEDLRSVVMQLIQQERTAREKLLKTSKVGLEDRVYRSFGLLSHSRLISYKEAAKCLSDVRLGIDLNLISNMSANILNELMIVSQPNLLQAYAGEGLEPEKRDILRAKIIRERMKLEKE
ncbi:protein arginine kinase [Lottiidibacillus patelloidae]|uniref:Protein-arginine kinase n=1 Tax=Lottiidibacillus patelloidae TaxID=2670334 RepID=A0A263BQ79_9BACI|nr:protein arginine kinase [Lottiidibacillus patelloidae]OZM55874.1 protein arginine kinase [Lottiidibacillus patelloidae]